MAEVEGGALRLTQVEGGSLRVAEVEGGAHRVLKVEGCAREVTEVEGGGGGGWRPQGHVYHQVYYYAPPSLSSGGH